MTWLLDNAGLSGLLFFFVFFSGVLLWLYRPSMKQPLESLANIPLDEDDHDRS